MFATQQITQLIDLQDARVKSFHFHQIPSNEKNVIRLHRRVSDVVPWKYFIANHVCASVWALTKLFSKKMQLF